MKKKLIPLILVIVCAIACAFGLAACGGGGGGGDNSKPHTITIEQLPEHVKYVEYYDAEKEEDVQVVPVNNSVSFQKANGLEFRVVFEEGYCAGEELDEIRGYELLKFYAGDTELNSNIYVYGDESNVAVNDANFKFNKDVTITTNGHVYLRKYEIKMGSFNFSYANDEFAEGIRILPTVSRPTYETIVWRGGDAVPPYTYEGFKNEFVKYAYINVAEYGTTVQFTCWNEKYPYSMSKMIEPTEWNGYDLSEDLYSEKTIVEDGKLKHVLTVNITKSTKFEQHDEISRYALTFQPTLSMTGKDSDDEDSINYDCKCEILNDGKPVSDEPLTEDSYGYVDLADVVKQKDYTKFGLRIKTKNDENIIELIRAGAEADDVKIYVGDIAAKPSDFTLSYHYASFGGRYAYLTYKNNITLDKNDLDLSVFNVRVDYKSAMNFVKTSGRFEKTDFTDDPNEYMQKYDHVTSGDGIDSMHGGLYDISHRISGNWAKATDDYNEKIYWFPKVSYAEYGFIVYLEDEFMCGNRLEDIKEGTTLEVKVNGKDGYSLEAELDISVGGFNFVNVKGDFATKKEDVYDTTDNALCSDVAFLEIELKHGYLDVTLVVNILPEDFEGISISAK